MINNTYVLITPARNEEAYINKTLNSVVRQTILPLKWIIVNDGSTDRTDEIVEEYIKIFDFIEIVNREADQIRNFESKAFAIKNGYERLKGLQYEFIGNLDADISFEENYYENIINKFNENEKLGIVGGLLFDNVGGTYQKQLISLDSVSGPIQLFRRKCYEAIGGYLPLKHGGIDAVAEVMARMTGWQTQSFSDLKVIHHRRTWSEGRNIWQVRFSEGVLQYLLGYHYLYHLGSCLKKIFQRPYVLGTILQIFGYLWCFVIKKEREIPDNFVKYIRQEQLQKLFKLFG